LPFVLEIPLEIERSEENGGKLILKSPEELHTLFSSGNIHPGDLKKMVAKEVSAIFSRVTGARRNEVLSPASKSGGGK
jgi:hypothetical protein